MKVIKEALRGKVSRLFKHGADAVQSFNTESYLQWLGEARRAGKADVTICYRAWEATRAANLQSRE